MRASLQLTITGFLALVAGASIFAFAAGASATDLRDGTYIGDLSASTPTNLAPASGQSIEYPIEPISMTWDAVPGVTKYEVEVAQDANGVCDTTSQFDAKVVVANTTTSDTGYMPAMIDPTGTSSSSKEKSGKDITSGNYCWHVRAVDDGSGGTAPGAWSAVSRFSVVRTVTPTNLHFYNDTDGMIPRTSAAPDFATGSASSRNSGYLSWDPVPGTDGYDVQIASSATFSTSSVAMSVMNTKSTTLVLPWLPDQDSYYWHVRTDGGPWSAAQKFVIQRYSSTWISGSSKTPAYNAATHDYAFGWDPVPGAAYYQVEAATSPSCFWDDPDNSSTAPMAWADSSGNGCRLSDTSPDKNTTINNWATSNLVLSSSVIANVRGACNNKEGDPACTASKDFPSKVYWRVRPVWQITRAHESIVNYQDDMKMYGAWLQDDTLPRPNMFNVTRSVAYDAVSGAASDHRCAAPNNPSGGDGCLHLMNGGISASNPASNSTTMQLPVLQWGAFPGAAPNPSGPGGYVIQIARDPFMVDKVYTGTVANGATMGAASLSFSLPTGLPDDEDGYWWRAIPCQSPDQGSPCRESYYEDAAGDPAVYNDGAEPQMFTKHVEVSTRVADLGTATPLLAVAARGASTPADWSRGIQGAEYYQFQLSRTPNFPTISAGGSTNFGPGLLSTSQPRIQPQFGGSSGSSTDSDLAGGRWYWRARGVDHNDIASGWSDTSEFSVNLPAPTITSGNGAMGDGVVATWTPINGARTYRFEYSTTPDFSAGVTSIVTAQIGYRIPSTMLGTVYWRVRGEDSAKDLSADAKSTVTAQLIGAWSAVSSSSIVPQSKLRYGSSATTAKAGAKVTFEGQLSVSGTSINGQTVQLQRKSSTCAGDGSYSAIAKGQTTGDGRASMAAVVLQNACYRMVYSGGATLYSPSFEVDVNPVLKAKRLAAKQRKVARGKRTCVRMSSNRVINGQLTFEYRLRKKGAEWTPASGGKVHNFKRAKTLCFKLPAAGSQSVRATFSGMNAPGQSWALYADTSLSLGTFKVNNVWIKKKATSKRKR